MKNHTNNFFTAGAILLSAFLFAFLISFSSLPGSLQGQPFFGSIENGGNGGNDEGGNGGNGGETQTPVTPVGPGHGAPLEDGEVEPCEPGDDDCECYENGNGDDNSCFFCPNGIGPAGCPDVSYDSDNEELTITNPLNTEGLGTHMYWQFGLHQGGAGHCPSNWSADPFFLWPGKTVTIPWPPDSPTGINPDVALLSTKGVNPCENPAFCSNWIECGYPELDLPDPDDPVDPVDPEEFTLDVDIEGGGTVTSNVGNINCPGACSESYGDGQEVTLTATPEAGWITQSWGGDAPAGCSGNTCPLTIDANKNVTITFEEDDEQIDPPGNGNGNGNGDPGDSCALTGWAWGAVGKENLQ